MELPKIVQELPPAPADVRDWILKEVVRGRYLIYSLQDDYAVCTYCGKYHKISDAGIIPVPKHNEKRICPNCWKAVICKSKGRGRANLLEMTRVMVLVKRGKSIYVSITEVDIDFRGELPEVKIWLQAVYKFNRKEQLYVKHHPGWCYCGEYWEPRKKINVPPVGGWFGWHYPKREGLFVYDRNFNKLFNGTDLKYADVQEVYREKNLDAYELLQYLYLSAKFQSVELLRKAGFWSLVASKMAMEPGSKAINWKATNLKKILGLNMGQIREIRREEFDMRALEIYKQCLRTGDKVDSSGIELIRVSWRNDMIKKYTSLGKAANYLVKQQAGYKKGCIIMNDYEDYLTECEKLGYNMKDTKILFPKNFKAEHKRASERVRELKDQIDAKEFKKNQLKITGMTEPYIADGFLIRLAESAAELRAEGQALGHCVGGYAQGVIDGYRAILFVREADKPHKPFYTLELWEDKTIVQCRGKANRSMTEEVKAFVEKWHQEVIMNKKSKSKKQKEVA